MKKGLQTLILGFSLILLFSLKAEARIITNTMTPDAARSADTARSTDPSAPAGGPSSILSTHITSTSPTYLLKTDSVSSTTHITLYLNEPVPTGGSTIFLFDDYFVPVIERNPERTKITIAITGNYLDRARMSELKVCERISPCSEPYSIQICSSAESMDCSATHPVVSLPSVGIPHEIPAEAPPIAPTATAPTTTPPVATAPTTTPPVDSTFTAQNNNPENGGCNFSAALPSNISLGLFASFFLQILGLVVWRFKK